MGATVITRTILASISEKLFLPTLLQPPFSDKQVLPFSFISYASVKSIPYLATAYAAPFAISMYHTVLKMSPYTLPQAVYNRFPAGRAQSKITLLSVEQPYFTGFPGRFFHLTRKHRYDTIYTEVSKADRSAAALVRRRAQLRQTGKERRCGQCKGYNIKEYLRFTPSVRHDPT